MPMRNRIHFVVRRHREKFSCVGDPEDPARVVLVVCDAAVAHTPLSHDGVHARISHGHAAAASWLVAMNERVDRSVTAVFFLNFAVAATPHQEPYATRGSGQSQNSNDNACSNCSRVAVAAAAVAAAWRRSCGFDSGRLGRGLGWLCCGRGGACRARWLSSVGDAIQLDTCVIYREGTRSTTSIPVITRARDVALLVVNER